MELTCVTCVIVGFGSVESGLFNFGKIDELVPVMQEARPKIGVNKNKNRYFRGRPPFSHVAVAVLHMVFFTGTDTPPLVGRLARRS